MLKLVAIGVWLILVTAGATFGAVYLAKTPPRRSPQPPNRTWAWELKSEMTSVPVMRNSDIAGYLILQLSFAADRAARTAQARSAALPAGCRLPRWRSPAPM